MVGSPRRRLAHNHSFTFSLSSEDLASAVQPMLFDLNVWISVCAPELLVRCHLKREGFVSENAKM